MLGTITEDARYERSLRVYRHNLKLILDYSWQLDNLWLQNGIYNTYQAKSSNSIIC